MLRVAHVHPRNEWLRERPDPKKLVDKATSVIRLITCSPWEALGFECVHFPSCGPTLFRQQLFLAELYAIEFAPAHNIRTT
jgi:hypothetical protein